jgi:hypothetical protein
VALTAGRAAGLVTGMASLVALTLLRAWQARRGPA